MICIYHNKDLDGFTSGAIMKLKYPDATMYGYDYSEIFDIEPYKIEEHGEMIMADVSLPMSTMKEFSEMCKSFTWVDHHISAIKEYQSGEDFLNAVLDNTISACEGTWKYLFSDKPMPKAVRLLGEYDTWRNQDKKRWDNEILPFQFGMRELCNSVDSFPADLFDLNKDFSMIDTIIEKGKTILSYQAKINELQCKKAAFETRFEGLRAICLNGGGFNSDVFKSVYDENKHDIMMPFQFNGKKWTVSLYTTKDIDVSAIAKKRKGGGHLRASGFEVDDISSIFPQIKTA